MSSEILSLWLSVAFLTLFFLLVIAAIVWMMLRQEAMNRTYLTELSQQSQSLAKNSLATLELLNKSLTLLSVKDPMSYQAVAGMELQYSDTEDKYYPQDDVSEAQRVLDLTRNNNDDSAERLDFEYDPSIHGDFDYDLGTKH